MASASTSEPEPQVVPQSQPTLMLPPPTDMTAIVNSAAMYSAPDITAPQWRLDLMMEKLRRKRKSFKPLAETAKNLRQALVERRCFLDANDKLHLQKCLDTLQQSIQVNSLSSMVERLDMVSRQLGLKLSPGANEQEWFISSDMFYLEVLIDSNGTIKDMKIQHEGKTEQLQCPDLIKSLEAKDFSDFAEHLQGLISIYNLNADKHIKSKAFIALQALETDLAAIASTYAVETKADHVIMKNLLGHFQPRRGGHPVKLTYCISPYDFFDKETNACIPNEISDIVKRKIGNSATISIQGSPGVNRKLQMSTIVTVYNSPEGKALPRYGVLSPTNSTALPACFVLTLDKPIPIFKVQLNSIHTATGIENGFEGEPKPILNLITQVVSNNQLDCSEGKGLFVSLPDQHHCYYMTQASVLDGVVISTINFTMASQLSVVLATLRQQLMFNTLIGSCVRPNSKPEDGRIVFEVTALSHHNLSVSFQHPLDDSLVTLEFDIKDVMAPSCRVHALYSTTPDMIPTLEEHACSVVRRSMSIPVTLRAVIRRWQTMRVKAEVPKPESLVPSSGTSSSFNPILPMSAPSCALESQQIQQSSFKPMNFNTPAQTAPIDFISYMNNPIFASLSQNFQASTKGQILAAAAAAAQSGIPSSSVLQGLLDQSNSAKKKKRSKFALEIQKSPLHQKSPVRQDEMGNSTAPNWMTELGLEPDGRWNIDITPVKGSQTTEELRRKFPVKRSVSLDSNLDSDDRLPNVSITPMNSSAGTTSTVNSLLASIRPGIEIIPLSNQQAPPNIPNSITVTPVLPNLPDLKKIKRRTDEILEKKKIKKFEVRSVTKLQGGKPSVSTMKSVSSTFPKPRKLTKPCLDAIKVEKDKSLIIYQPPKTQAATQAVAAALAAAKTQSQVTKKGSLDSVINKLKLNAGADCEGMVKKAEQLSTKDLLKASSNITDIIQKSAKANEYSVKTSAGLVPGGGLKLTINKAIPTKFGLDIKKKMGLKRPLGQKSKLLVTGGLSREEPKRPLVKKEEMNKITETRKLFMPSLEPGTLFKDSPKFDLKNFQIPKKSKPAEKADLGTTSCSPVPDKIVPPPELTVEAVNPPVSISTTSVTPPRQDTPPRQATPQPSNGSLTAPLPPIAQSCPPLLSIQPPPVNVPALLLSTPLNLTTSSETSVESGSKTEEVTITVKPMDTNSEAKAPSQTQPTPTKETISPESPDMIDSSDIVVAPQNIPTTPPETAEELQEKVPVESEGFLKAIPAPVPPPARSVTPIPLSRSATPAPVSTPSNGVPNLPRTSSVSPTPPISTSTTVVEKEIPFVTDGSEEQLVNLSKQAPPVTEPSPLVSMHCIVKSPAPNSPMLLRSPALILHSPHTPIDDDLMDEALVGGGPRPNNNDKTAS